MLPLLLALTIGAAPGEETVAGTVRVTKGGGLGDPRAVSLATPEGALRLHGALVVEVERLQSISVEVIGHRRDDGFEVKAYQILDVGGGARPLVGTLVELPSGFGLRDGTGTDIPLSLPPRSRERLSDKAGAKLWVHGNRLLSGELKVLKYGILRDPPPKAVQP